MTRRLLQTLKKTLLKAARRHANCFFARLALKISANSVYGFTGRKVMGFSLRFAVLVKVFF